jgi:hypothetical protein
MAARGKGKPRTAAKRTRVKNRAGTFLGRRDERGRFEDMDNVKRALPADRRRKAKTKAKKGQKDRGD